MWWQNEYWRSEDGTVRYPARGEMNHNHIRNTMSFIDRNAARYYESWGDRLNIHTLSNFILMLHESPLWNAFYAGLRTEDPGEYPEQEGEPTRRRTQLGPAPDISNYTFEEHIAYKEWASRRNNNE